MTMAGELKRIEAALAHDLNNALQVLMGNLELLKRRREFVPRVVEAALDATRQAALLADRLGTVGRLRSQEPRIVDVNALLGELRELLELTCGEAIRVDLAPAADLRKALVDPHVVHLALVELATNARAAMPGGGRLTITTSNARQRLVLIEVADNGKGMPPEARERAFQPLAAAEGGKPGGLGLRIVEQCMLQAGGRLELGGTSGAGARVRLFLPAA
jgi:signal transduction histidine kinase